MIRLVISFGRVIRAGMHNFVRNLWLSMAATAIMVVTLVIILSTLAINNATKDTLEDAAQDITISVFLKDSTSEEQRLAFEQDLNNNPDVNSVDYISKEEALEIYLERNEGDEELLSVFEVLGENPTQASYEIELNQLSENANLLSLLGSDNHSEAIDDFNSERLERASRVGDLQNYITRAGLGAGVVFAIISVLVIFNTIRMAIFTRSNEIQIMKLIGATNNYIRGPFLVEASLYGVLSGGIALAIVYPIVDKVSESQTNFLVFGPTAEIFTERVVLISAITIAVGMLIGVVSSLLAMTRYLRLHSIK